MHLPDFFIIGAPRCGTTAVFHYLSENPSVFLPRFKEPHYYCKDFPSHRYCRDPETYAALFKDASAESLIGEGSVWYLFSAVAVAEIIKDRPDAKVIVMLRNPADAARSLHAKLLTEMNEDIADFETAWRAQADRAAGRRLPFHTTEPSFTQYGKVYSFAGQLERLLQTIPRRQVYFIIYEEFFADPARYYNELLDFLGVPSDGRTQFDRVNAMRYPGNKKIYELISRPPVLLRPLLRLLRKLSRSFGLHLGAYMHFAVKQGFKLEGGIPGQRHGEFEKELDAYFADDIARVERLLGRSLDSWRARRE